MFRISVRLQMGFYTDSQKPCTLIIMHLIHTLHVMVTTKRIRTKVLSFAKNTYHFLSF